MVCCISSIRNWLFKMEKTTPILFSIIMPVYKPPQALLHGALKSLCDQGFKEAEFIIVDDGTPDHAGEICDQYALLDARFKVFHEENYGVSVARNTGIEKACGKYILFLDADDQLAPRLLEQLAQAVNRETFDIAFFKNIEVSESEIAIFPYDTNKKGRLLESIAIAECVVSNNEEALRCENINFGAPWGKVFKRDFLKAYACRFPVGIKKSQDRIFLLDCLAHSPKCLTFDLWGYAYVQSEESTCHKYNPDIAVVLDDTYKRLIETVNKLYSQEEINRLEKSYPYLKFVFFIAIVRQTFFHQDNPALGEEMQDFVDYCKTWESTFKKCKLSGVSARRWKVLLLASKLHMYKSLYKACVYYANHKTKRDT